MNKNENSVFTLENANQYCENFCSCLQSHNREAIQEALLELKMELNPSEVAQYDSKLMLIHILLTVKQTLLVRYHSETLLIADNYSIVKNIMQSEYIQDIMAYFEDQFELTMSSLTGSTNGKVIYDILHYINHNYKDNIQLSALAALFGYNSSYLGKLFTRKIGMSFNTYLDYIRVSRSKTLLLQQDMKVYSIAEQVGYRNVDYFHQKFKNHTGMTPLEFRKKYIQ